MSQVSTEFHRAWRQGRRISAWVSKRDLYGGNGHLLAHQRVALLRQPFVVQKLAIEREERHLLARFGKTFVDYAERVRRWIQGHVWHHFASSEMVK